MSLLTLGGECLASSVELDRKALSAIDKAYQVPDVGSVVAGRTGRAVRLEGLVQRAVPSGEARFVHVESSDGSFTANVALEDARRDGLVLYEHEGGPLPSAFGGPFRLLFADGTDCSVNVKALGRIDFVSEPGSHTARCAEDA